MTTEVLVCARVPKQAVTAKPPCYISHQLEEWPLPYCSPLVMRHSPSITHTAGCNIPGVTSLECVPIVSCGFTARLLCPADHT